MPGQTWPLSNLRCLAWAQHGESATSTLSSSRTKLHPTTNMDQNSSANTYNGANQIDGYYLDYVSLFYYGKKTFSRPVSLESVDCQFFYYCYQLFSIDDINGTPRNVNFLWHGLCYSSSLGIPSSYSPGRISISLVQSLWHVHLESVSRAHISHIYCCLVRYHLVAGLSYSYQRIVQLCFTGLIGIVIGQAKSTDDLHFIYHYKKIWNSQHLKSGKSKKNVSHHIPCIF